MIVVIYSFNCNIDKTTFKNNSAVSINLITYIKFHLNCKCLSESKIQQILKKKLNKNNIKGLQETTTVLSPTVIVPREPVIEISLSQIFFLEFMPRL